MIALASGKAYAVILYPLWIISLYTSIGVAAVGTVVTILVLDQRKHKSVPRLS